MAKWKTIRPSVKVNHIYLDDKGRVRTGKRRKVSYSDLRKYAKGINPHTSSSGSSQAVQNQTYVDEPVAPPPVQDVQEKHQSTYACERERTVEQWSSFRPSIISVSVENEAPVLKCIAVPGQECTEQAQIRCADCGPHAHYCPECYSRYHKNVTFHKPEIYDEECGYQMSNMLTKVDLPPHDCPSRKYSRILNVWDRKGRPHTTEVFFCDCEDECAILVRHNLWPSTPLQPQVAFHFHLLDWWMAFLLEGQVSTNTFCNALRLMNPNIPSSMYISLYKQLVQDSCDEYRHYKHKMANVVSRDTDSIICPACPSDKGNVFVSMDACFSLVKRRTDATNIKPLHQNSMFLDQTGVDEFVEGYGIKQNGTEAKECNDFHAGDRVRSSATTGRLNVTAVFGASCKHEIPMAFMDLRHGERFSYGIYMLQHLQKCLHPGTKLHVLYDVACMLSSHIKRNCPDLANISLAIRVFHAYGHKMQCQLLMNPRRLDTFGLVDGECMERLWSYLGKFSKITKEMTSGRRKDLLTDALFNFRKKKLEVLGATLCQKMERAKKIEAVSSERLEELKASYVDKVITPEDVHEWYKSEQALNSCKNKASLTWQEKYLDALDNLRTTRLLMLQPHSDEEAASLGDKAERLETTLKNTERIKKIRTRWSCDSSDYLSTKSQLVNKRRAAMLQVMRNKARDIQFLNSLRAKYTDGQKVAVRLAKQQKAAASSLHQCLRNVNLISHGRHSLLQYTDVNTADASIYSLKASEKQNESVPISLKREIIENWLQAKRAAEEVDYIKREMVQVESYYQKLGNALDNLKLEHIEGASETRYNAGLANIINQENHMCKKIQEDLKRKFSAHQSGDAEHETLEDLYFPEDEENFNESYTI